MVTKRYAALLRAVNVGGNNQVSMPELRDALATAGFAPVQTLLNSGNVVLTASVSAAAVKKAVADAIEREFGLSIAVIVRDHRQLTLAIKRNPFPERAGDGNRLMCGFFATTPKPVELDPARYQPDEFRIVGDEIYLWYPDGSGRSKLSVPAIEKAVGAGATVRNWNTVTKLAALTT